MVSSNILLLSIYTDLSNHAMMVAFNPVAAVVNIFKQAPIQPFQTI